MLFRSGDEPAFTQPLLYQRIAAHPTVRELFARTLVARGVVSEADATAMPKKYVDQLQAVLDGLKPEVDFVEQIPPVPPSGAAGKVKTAVALDRLAELNTDLLKLPEGFNVHKKLIRGREKRAQVFASPTERSIDWATAEELAYASILTEGTSIRLTGEDVERGTFSHRHAVVHDPATGVTFSPLQSIPQAKAAFEVHNSPLTELATIGFEFGYNVQEPSRLVVWEAQYGDFINGAQIILDTFVTSGRAKWGLTPSLVLLLPHGYEGQGPEHSSARPERFLQLCADYNIQVCMPATPVQMFFLLRRQMIRPWRKPLVIFTPKSLLRHKDSVSPLSEFADSKFNPVNWEWNDEVRPEKAKRVIFCSGKVFFDLINKRRELARDDVAIIRVAQLYPFPHDEFQATIDHFPAAKEVIWCQEESGNQGAWHRIQHYILRHMRADQVLGYAMRASSASPAVGYLQLHNEQQKALTEAAFAPLTDNLVLPVQGLGRKKGKKNAR